MHKGCPQKLSENTYFASHINIQLTFLIFKEYKKNKKGLIAHIKKSGLIHWLFVTCTSSQSAG